MGTLEASTEDAHGAVRVLGRGKPVAMLAYLACIPGHKASREHLATLLWGDVESDAARQNLRQTLWYLKKKLGDGLLEVNGEVVSLVASASVDRDDFLHAAQRADFAAAVQLHPGPFIPDFAAPGAAEFERWCELERRRLTVTYLRCADALARQWLSEGRFRDAQELARRARDTDPMDQATWRLLLEALVAGSDALGAMSEAEHFEAFLAAEEQEPEAASQSVIRLAQRVASAPREADAEPTLSIATELVGRETEFSRILSAWEQARNGSPRVLVLSAAAGLGKSRLLRDVQARLRASRSRCVLERANPGDRHLTGGFAAEVATQLAALPGAAAVSLGTAGVLVALAPALASTFPAAEPDRSDGEEALRRRALAFVDLARAVSEEHPVAVLLDDLHWADEHSARIIAAALSRSEHTRMLVVMAKRPSADPRALFSTFERIELPPLDLAAVTAFVSHVADLPAIPWAEVLPQQLLLATGGSPLLLVETLHSALEHGWLSVGPDGVWQCENAMLITDALRQGSAVRMRVLRLDAEPQHGLLALALFGRPVSLAEARAVMNGRDAGLDETVDLLERSGFISRSGAYIVVAHDEIADTVVELASEEMRARVHCGIARYLAEMATDETALRRAAEHARLGHDDDTLRKIWRRFAEFRRRRGDRRSTAALAADLLNEAEDHAATLVLVRATPFWARQRSRWQAGAAVAFVALVLLAVLWPRRAPKPAGSLFAVWVQDSVTGKGRMVAVRVAANESWTTHEPIIATDIAEGALPQAPVSANSALERVPGVGLWWGHVVSREWGGEGVLVDSTGRSRIPLQSRGDDAIEAFSPDGRWMLVNTARYDTLTDHLQLAVLSPSDTAVRRLTHSNTYDYSAHWRPDGTQILFLRRYFDRLINNRLCLIDFDGQRERCLNYPFQDASQLIGWQDNRHVLVKTEDGVLRSIDVETEEQGSINGILIVNNYGQGGDVLVCNCRVDETTPASIFVFPRDNPGAARPVIYRGSPLRGALRHIAPTQVTRQWLERLSIRTPTQPLSVDLVHRLVADGHLANGVSSDTRNLRWLSRDTTVATVDSTGRLRPRRIGSVWVVVSAGGWRTDSTRVSIAAPSATTALSETWDARWLERWVPFGTPKGAVTQLGGRHVFMPNGDGSYTSGAFAARPVDARRGVGLEAVVRMPITAVQWQTLNLHLMAHRGIGSQKRVSASTGETDVDADFLCQVGFPGTEGLRGLREFTLAGIPPKALSAPPGLYDGSWHRVRLQLLEDNRCALAIDGRPIAMRQSAASRPDTLAIIVITGHERFNGQLAVSSLEAWSGVRGGIDWTVLDDAPTLKKR